MANNVIRTEHNGAKHGKGPLTKIEVKIGSKKARREAGKKEAGEIED